MVTTEPGMRTSSLSMSVIIHVLVLAAGLVTIPWLKKDYEIPQPLSVEIVDIAEMAQTTHAAPVPVKDDKKEKQKPPENKPPPAPKNTADKPQEVVRDKPLDKPDEVKKDEVLVDENAPPQKKLDKKDDKKKKVTKAEPKKDFSSVLKNLADSKDKPLTPAKEPDMKADENPPEAAENLPVGMKMTMAEKTRSGSSCRAAGTFPSARKTPKTLWSRFTWSSTATARSSQRASSTWPAITATVFSAPRPTAPCGPCRRKNVRLLSCHLINTIPGKR